MTNRRTLSRRELTVALLARQLLLDRQDIDVVQCVRRLAALQAQYSPSPYVALFSRLASFEVAELEDALTAGTVVKSTLMRGTLHLVAAQDYPSLATAWQQQWLADLRGRYRKIHIDEERIRAGLREFTRQPRTTDEIRDRFAELGGSELATKDLLHYARALVPMRHVFPSGAWRQHGKFSMVSWPQEQLVAEPAATALLVRRYLEAFGPAAREDIAHFSGLRYRQLDPAIAELGAVRHFADPDGRELLDLPDAPRPAEEVVVPVRFLAKWDAAIISHRDRTRILPAAWHKRVVKTVNGDVLSTYLLDGQVAGTWTTTRHGDVATVVLTAFTPVPSQTQSELEREAIRMVTFVEPDAKKHEVTFAPGK